MEGSSGSVGAMIANQDPHDSHNDVSYVLLNGNRTEHPLMKDMDDSQSLMKKRTQSVTVDGVMESDAAERLRFAKILAFASGASMVAWNKFSVLWFMSVGLTPSQAGLLKSLGQLAKTFAQPAWGALADMHILAKCHRVFEHSHMHMLAVSSLLMSLVMMEVLHNTAGQASFAAVVAVRTAWACVNSGTILVDAMVVQMAHRTREGYGKQRLWGSVAMGMMSILSGAAIDRFGLEFVFTYSHISRLVLVACVLFAMTKARHGALPTELELGSKASVRKRWLDNMDTATYVRMVWGMVANNPAIGLCLASNFVLGCGMVVTDFLVSIQMERDLGMSRTLNGLASTVSTVIMVPCFYYSDDLIRRFGHMRIMVWAQGLCVVQLMLHSLITKDWGHLIIPLSTLKGAVFALHWSSSVDYMNQSVDPHLASTSQTMLTWAYWTVGGGLGYTLWTAIYQRVGASPTYLLAAAMLSGNIILLRVGLTWSRMTRLPVAGGGDADADDV